MVPTNTPPPSSDSTPTSIERVRFMARLDPDLHAALAAAAEELDWSTNSALNEAVREWLRRRQDNQARVDRPDAANLVDLQPMTGATPGTFALLVDGFRVPYVKVYKTPGTGTAVNGFGTASLLLDDRFSIEAKDWDQLWRWAWFLANAMAVAAGYTSHGPNGYRRNLHGPSEPTDFAAWAEHGWTVHESSGSLGKGYELTLSFRWPNMDDGDLQCYSVREEIVRFLTETGARDVTTRLIAVGPMMAEPVAEPS